MFRSALLIVLVASFARAQPSEMTLDTKGEWVPVPAPAKSADAKVMDEARRLLANDEAGKARYILDKWLDANKHNESAHMSEAYLLRGDAKTAVGSEYRALYDYEVVAKDYAATTEFVKAVEREVEIGVRYVNGMRRRLLGFRIVKADDVGEELLVRAAERMPNSRLAERAVIELADYYYRTRDLKMAVIAYQKFAELFPRSQHIQRARQQRIYASIGLFKGPNYDAAGLADAKVLIEEYAKDDPVGAQRANLSDALLAKLDESIAAQLLERSRYYLRRGDPVSARATLRRLIHAHPQSVAASDGEKIMIEHKWTIPGRPARPVDLSSPQP